jgi:hypothetical protein
MQAPKPAPENLPFSNIGELYAILELPPTATKEEVTKAYRRLVKIYHPDKTELLPPQEKEEYTDKFRKINLAYTLLMNDDELRRYPELQQQPPLRRVSQQQYPPDIFSQQQRASHFFSKFSASASESAENVRKQLEEERIKKRQQYMANDGFRRYVNSYALNVEKMNNEYFDLWVEYYNEFMKSKEPSRFKSTTQQMAQENKAIKELMNGLGMKIPKELDKLVPPQQTRKLKPPKAFVKANELNSIKKSIKGYEDLTPREIRSREALYKYYTELNKKNGDTPVTEDKFNLYVNEIQEEETRKSQSQFQQPPGIPIHRAPAGVSYESLIFEGIKDYEEKNPSNRNIRSAYEHVMRLYPALKDVITLEFFEHFINLFNDRRKQGGSKRHYYKKHSNRKQKSNRKKNKTGKKRLYKRRQTTTRRNRGNSGGGRLPIFEKLSQGKSVGETVYAKDLLPQHYQPVERAYKARDDFWNREGMDIITPESRRRQDDEAISGYDTDSN